MRDAKDISSCRHCLFYEMQGRRGGQCRQLGVPVKGFWESCSLATSPFAPSWQDLENLVENIPVLHSPTFVQSVEEVEING